MASASNVGLAQRVGVFAQHVAAPVEEEPTPGPGGGDNINQYLSWGIGEVDGEKIQDTGAYESISILVHTVIQ